MPRTAGGKAGIHYTATDRGIERIARLTDLRIGGSYLNLDGGFDLRHNNKAIFNVGLIPNIKEPAQSPGPEG